MLCFCWERNGIRKNRSRLYSIVSVTFSVELQQPKTCFGQYGWEESYFTPSTQKPLLLASIPDKTGKPGVLGFNLLCSAGIWVTAKNKELIFCVSCHLPELWWLLIRIWLKQWGLSRNMYQWQRFWGDLSERGENAPEAKNCCAFCHQSWRNQHSFKSTPALKTTWGIQGLQGRLNQKHSLKGWGLKKGVVPLLIVSFLSSHLLKGKGLCEVVVVVAKQTRVLILISITFKLCLYILGEMEKYILFPFPHISHMHLETSRPWLKSCLWSLLVPPAIFFFF